MSVSLVCRSNPMVMLPWDQTAIVLISGITDTISESTIPNSQVISTKQRPKQVAVSFLTMFAKAADPMTPKGSVVTA